MPSTSYEEVTFRSEGADLYGRLYRPASSAAAPAIAMAHGTSATITMTADKYAEAFAARGVAALVYDHINHGRSGGEPRGEMNPWIQARGYVDALTFLEKTKGIDAARLAIWGDSYSGGEVLALAPCDARVRVVIAQVPNCGLDAPARAGTAEELALFQDTLLKGDVRSDPEIIGPMPIVSFDQMGSPSLLKPIQAYRWFIEYGGRHGTAWANRGARVVPKTRVPFAPYISAGFMKAAVMILASPADEFPHCAISATRATFAMMPVDEKHLVEVDGGHFGLLHHPSEIFDFASRTQADFLARQLHV